MKCLSLFGAVGLAVLCGCTSPNISTSVNVDPDDDPIGGAITSGDIRTFAAAMTPKLLALPELSNSSAPVRITVAEFQNNSRFLIDKEMFMRKLRTELNRYGEGRIRFFAQGKNVAATRTKMLTVNQTEQAKQQIAAAAREIAASPIFRDSTKAVRVAVLPPVNTNLVNLNAESFSAMLRSELLKVGNGKILVLAPGSTKGADYFIAGQFYPESVKTEGIVNLLDYVGIIRKRLESGQSLDVTDNRVPATSRSGSVEAWTNVEIARQSELVRIMRDPKLQQMPNTDKNLSLMLVPSHDDIIAFETTVKVEKRITDGTEKGVYILSGTISALSQRKGGAASDYLQFSVQLSDTAANEIVWEDMLEVKRVTNAGIVYQ